LTWFVADLGAALTVTAAAVTRSVR